MVSSDRLRFLVNRFRARLWVRPLAVCLLSIGAAFAARLADDTGLAALTPYISPESIEDLLSIMAASMLVIATFSVTSMVSAYASAGSTATPRSFPLVVADDVSQNALSSFIGAFIFSLVALTAVKNDFFGRAGLFILFCLAVAVFAVVIVTLVRWVDRIARLGRLGSTIDKVEKAAAAALTRRRNAPTLGGVRVRTAGGQAVFTTRVGYVQHLDIAALQTWADENQARVVVAALPGTFTVPGRPLAHVVGDSVGRPVPASLEPVAEAFVIGDDRLFDDDPRFGLVVLSEIAGRALSPGINDPGTAIDITGTLVRLFALWSAPAAPTTEQAGRCERIEVPELSVRDMMDDAFTAIGRDGAGAVEVAVRLQKALASLASLGGLEMREAARHHAQLALKRSEKAMDLAEDVDLVRSASAFAVP